MPKPPDVLNTEIVAKSRLFKVQAVHLRFSNGNERTFERLTHTRSGAVLIVPMLDDNTVLLVREYACGLNRYELGLPKGLIEPDETPIAAANREMSEEIGYAARELTEIKTMSLAPGYISLITNVILARDLYEKKAVGDEPEPIEVIPWSLDNLPELLERDDFSEARSIAALYLARDVCRHG